jgi:hypothetical protein
MEDIKSSFFSYTVGPYYMQEIGTKKFGFKKTKDGYKLEYSIGSLKRTILNRTNAKLQIKRPHFNSDEITITFYGKFLKFLYNFKMDLRNWYFIIFIVC